MINPIGVMNSTGAAHKTSVFKSDTFGNYQHYPYKTVRKLIRKWVDECIRPRRREYDEHWNDDAIFEEAFKVIMVDQGWQKALFPYRYGGWSVGNIPNLGTLCAVLFEEIARGDLGMNIAFLSGFWIQLVITIPPYTNERLLEELAPFHVKPELYFGALYMTEPQGGSDIENVDLNHGKTIRTVAIQDGNEWVINGHKLWPSNSGGVADLHGLVCTTRPGSTSDEDIAFIFVPQDTPGVSFGKPYQKAGCSSDKNSDVWYEDVRVPLHYRALGPGLDAMRYKEVMCLAMMTAMFSVAPLMDIYETLNDFCSTKTLHGLPLKEHDAVAAELAEIASTIEVCRNAMWSLGAMLDRPDLYGPRWSHQNMAKARLTKNFVCDKCQEEAVRAMNILQEYGADRNWDIEKQWRDMKMVQLWLGGKQLAQMEGARHFYDCKTL